MENCLVFQLVTDGSDGWWNHDKSMHSLFILTNTFDHKNSSNLRGIQFLGIWIQYEELFLKFIFKWLSSLNQKLKIYSLHFNSVFFTWHDILQSHSNVLNVESWKRAGVLKRQ